MHPNSQITMDPRILYWLWMVPSMAGAFGPAILYRHVVPGVSRNSLVSQFPMTRITKHIASPNHEKECNKILWRLHSSNHQEYQGTEKTPIRFLGKGEHAIVREGAVLLSPHNEFHHYYRQSAIFIYSMGMDEHSVYCIRGLIIDHPTPFTLREMIPDDPRFKTSALGDNLIHRGGDKGKDGVILLHDINNINGDSDAASAMIGTSNLYQGGWDEAMRAIENGTATSNNVKAFFNYCEFTEMEIEELLQSTEDGDAWISVEVDRKLILSQEWDRGGCWRRLRNAVREYAQ